VLISSSLPSAAAWFNEQLSEPANFATQILPDPTRTPLTPGTPTQPAESGHRAPAHVSRGPEATDQKDTKQVKQHSETRRRSGRHVARKDAGSAGTAETENQTPFLSVLGDILPNDGQTGARKPDSGGNLEWASASKLSNGAGMPADTGTNGSTNNVAAATAQTQTAGNSSVATAPATTIGRGGEPASQTDQIDPSVEIMKAGAPIDAQGWQQDAGGPGQVAFTARITELAAVPATQGLSRADAAIAAARFDTSNVGSHFTASDNAQPHPAPSSNANQLADPTSNRPLEQAKPVGTEEPLSLNQSAQPPATAGKSGSAPAAADRGSLSATPSSQDQPVNPAVNSNPGQPTQAPPDNQFSTKANSQSASAGQNGDRSTAQSTSREISPVGAVSATAGARAVAGGSQNASLAMSAGQTLSNAPEDSRNTATPKPEANGRTLQTPEARNEPNEAASGSVRDIAIQLTNKDQGTVQVRLSERAGELRVSVRTPDVGLSRGLRDGVSELVGRLDHSGYRTETWQPSDGKGSSGGDQGHESPPQGGSSHGQHGGGSQSGAGQQRNPQDQQRSDTPIPEWSGELQSSLQRSTNAWLPSATR
jgi:hypothetical protein